MNEQEFLHVIGGAGVGGGLILTLGKLFLQRLIKNLEESTHKIHDVLIRLSAISVKLEILDHHQESIENLKKMVQEHDRAIAVLGEKASNKNTPNLRQA